MFKWFSLLVCVLAAFMGWYLAPEWHSAEPASLRQSVFASDREVLAASTEQARTSKPEYLEADVGAPRLEPDLGAMLERGDIDAVLAVVSEDAQGAGQDLDTLRSLTDAMIDGGRVHEALELLYELRLYWSADAEPALLDMVYEQVDQSEKRLAVQPVQPEVLVDLYQKLVILHPDHIPYSLKLATWQILAGDFYAAEQSLVSTVNDARYAQRTEALREELARARMEQENPSLRVPLKQIGKHYVAELLIGENRLAQMMIDTGASLSVVKSTVMAEVSGWEQIGVLTINTANGEVQGQRLLMPRMQLGDLALERVEMGVLPLESLKFDGLLGMDILGRFEFFIDQQQSELLLRPRG